MHFGDLLARLAEAGVESYAVDFRSRRATFYLADDRCCAIDFDVPPLAIAQGFDADAMRQAIRGAQRGEVVYPQFKRLAMQAGCVGYTTWIAGRHVTYTGRKGETHVERFPD